MGSQSHLTLSERHVIKNMKCNSQLVTNIAIAISKHRSTVYRELSNYTIDNNYDPDFAHSKYLLNRKYCFHVKEWNPKLSKLIVDKLKDGVSPDAIAGRLKYCDDRTMQPSSQTIYNWVISGYLGKGIQNFYYTVRKATLNQKTA